MGSLGSPFLCLTRLGLCVLTSDPQFDSFAVVGLWL